DHRRLLDPVDLGEDLLDLERVDVEAGDDHQVAHPVDEGEVAGSVEESDVARAPPPVLVRTVVAVRPVATEQVVPADLDLAGVLALEGGAGLVDQAQVDA